MTAIRISLRTASMVLPVTLLACEPVGVTVAPAKQPEASETELSKRAESVFWETLHAGDYEGIEPALELMTAAYLENPSNPDLAAHVGFLHIWRLAERRRLDEPPARITEHAAMCRTFFEEAVELAPHEARFLGFLGSCQAAEGTIHGDEKQRRRGYYTLLRSVKAWPEFNYFTAGYSLSRLDVESSIYAEAVDMQWKTLDRCFGEKVDRSNPEVAPYMDLEVHEGDKRVCWNSWIAPHNFEGFFLNFGDMLVKQGDWELARVVYAQAREVDTYPEWAYGDVLEARIRDAEANVEVFRGPGSGVPMMIESEYACSGCHQR